MCYRGKNSLAAKNICHREQDFLWSRKILGPNRYIFIFRGTPTSLEFTTLVAKCEKIAKNTFFQQNVRTFLKVSERIRTHLNASEQVRTGPSKSENFKKLAKTSKISRKF